MFTITCDICTKKLNIRNDHIKITGSGPSFTFDCCTTCFTNPKTIKKIQTLPQKALKDREKRIKKMVDTGKLL